MKKIFSLLLLMVAATVGFQSQAAMWLVGDAFNGWNESGNVEMTQNGDIYSYTAEIGANKYFAFFKDTQGWSYQRGPARGNDSAPLGDWEDTKSGGAWKTAAAGTYTIEYNYSTDQARIVAGSIVEPDPFDADALTFVATGEAVGGWNMPPTVVFTKNVDGTHSLEIEATVAEFKIAGVKDYSSLGWGDFDAGVYGGATLALGDNTLTAGQTANMVMPQAGKLLLTISDVTESSCKLNIAVVEEAQPAYYLVGEFNEWDAASAEAFTEANGVFTLTKTFRGEFKVLNENGDWLGAEADPAPHWMTTEYPSATLVKDYANLYLDAESEYTLTIENGVLTVAGFPAEPVVEIAAVELMGSRNDWAEPLGAFAAEDASTGYWTLNDVPFIANDEFKIRVRYSDQTEKWLAPESDGNFLMTEQLLGQELTLVEGGGNIYVEKAATLSFALAPAFDKLVITGEFEADPVVEIAAVELMGSRNEWAEPLGTFAAEDASTGYWTLNNVPFIANDEFKIRVRYSDQTEKWLAPESDGNFLMTEQLLGQELTLVEGGAANMYVEKAGLLSFALAPAFDKLVITGEFEADPVVEIAAVELMGSRNEWAEPLGTFAAEDASTGYWTLNDVPFIANDEFKIRVRYSDQTEKWLAPESDGNFLMTEELLGQELTLVEGGAANMYVEKAGLLSFALAPAFDKLVITGEFEADPVVEIAAVELMGSRNEWAEPLAAFAAEDASTGYWTLNDVPFIANDEFKIRVRYSDQTEKWLAPESDGNFLMTEELLGQELTLVEGGGNIYVEKAATLSFALAPALDKLVITGEFEADPVVEIAAVELMGSRNEWAEPLGAFAAEDASTGYWTLNDVPFIANDEFKIRVRYSDQTEKWLAPESDGNFLMTEELLGQELTLVEGGAANMYVEKAGLLSFALAPAFDKLVITGEFEADPVVEIAAVELMGSRNEWAEPLAAFAAEDASTGYWTLNDVPFIANDEFKIRVRYSDQTEKWLAPESDGNFLMTEELLGQELTLVEGGGNIYVEKAATLSFALAPAFDKLVITGEFEADPVVEIAAVELLGSSNEWTEPLGAFATEDASTGYWTLNDVAFAANDEFKIRVSYTDQTEKWFAPESDGNFLMTEELLGQELALVEGGVANMYVEKAATLSFALAPALDKLVITGEFEAEPVVEIAAVELMGSSNEWAEPLGAFAAEDASTGYWTLNDVPFIANDEFKIRVRYTDQTEKWLAPESDGNFLMTEQLLGQELALVEGGGNIYVEKAATLSFALAPALDKLVITGEFEAEPVVEIAAVELLGSSNEWAEPLGAFAAEDASTGYWTLNDVAFAANDEFKIRVRYSDLSEKWLAPVSDGNFLVNEDMLGQELALVEGGAANMYVEKAGTLSFALAPAFDNLYITGEFEQPAKHNYFLIGDFNGWDEEAPVPFVINEDNFTLDFNFSGEFKIKDELGNWYGGAAEPGTNYWLTVENPSVELVDGANLYIDGDFAEYSLTIVEQDGQKILTVEGFAQPVEEGYYLLGDFNEWSPNEGVVPFDQVEEGKWVASLPLEAGQQFKIITADNKWIGADPTDATDPYVLTPEWTSAPIVTEDPEAQVFGYNFQVSVAGYFTFTLEGSTLTVTGWPEGVTLDEALAGQEGLIKEDLTVAYVKDDKLHVTNGSLWLTVAVGFQEEPIQAGDVITAYQLNAADIVNPLTNPSIYVATVNTVEGGSVPEIAEVNLANKPNPMPVAGQVVKLIGYYNVVNGVDLISGYSGLNGSIGQSVEVSNASGMAQSTEQYEMYVVFTLKAPWEDAANGAPRRAKMTDDNWYRNVIVDILDTPVETGIDMLTADPNVAGVKFYNVAGQVSDQPFNGLNIIVTTYLDGTQKAVKVVR